MNCKEIGRFRAILDARIYYSQKPFGERDLNKTRGGLDASICYSHTFIGENGKKKTRGRRSAKTTERANSKKTAGCQKRLFVVVRSY